MTPPWSERRAWLYLAGRWDKAAPMETKNGLLPPRRRYYAQLLGHHRSGLCGCLRLLSVRRLAPVRKMRARMRAHPPRSMKPDFYWWRTNADGARRRAAYCRRMAELAAGEGGET